MIKAIVIWFWQYQSKAWCPVHILISKYLNWTVVCQPCEGLQTCPGGNPTSRPMPRGPRRISGAGDGWMDVHSSSLRGSQLFLGLLRVLSKTTHPLMLGEHNRQAAYKLLITGVFVSCSDVLFQLLNRNVAGSSIYLYSVLSTKQLTIHYWLTSFFHPLFCFIYLSDFW